MTPEQIAAAMVDAYSDRYERTVPLVEPIYACLAAALRALPPDADLAAVIDALEGMVWTAAEIRAAMITTAPTTPTCTPLTHETHPCRKTTAGSANKLPRG
jgi:hypothetical protein